DTFNHCVRKVDARSGTITTIVGTGEKGFSGDGGPAAKAQLDEPYGVALGHAGNLIVVGRPNRRVRRVDARTGLIETVAGDGSKIYSGDGGPADRAGLVEPNGVALDPEGKRLFIADVAGCRIRVVDLAAGTISTFSGTGERVHRG